MDEEMDELEIKKGQLEVLNNAIKKYKRSLKSKRNISLFTNIENMLKEYEIFLTGMLCQKYLSSKSVDTSQLTIKKLQPPHVFFNMPRMDSHTPLQYALYVIKSARESAELNLSEENKMRINILNTYNKQIEEFKKTD